MSSYDKAHDRREQAGMIIQAKTNVRNKRNLSVWDTLPYKEVNKEYSRLLKAKIDKDKCKKPRKHI
jgi:hypothetical protein